ncbi:C-type lectin domain family 7 member A isoform X2 [Trichomycterus rosablanca]|uniref:C-type lectin domain family 7 member A isoform X2 n=1 Tax=Trichomycterus rosablanca TaxID=2290929 RepID=UPI002F34F03F
MKIKFCKLGNYSGVEKTGQPQQEADIKRKARLYWRTSIVLLVLCLLLLAVVLALAIKLLEAGSVQSCPDRVEIGDKSDNSQACSPQLCQDMYPALVIQNQGYQCSECGKNWLKFENSCYFMSVKRLSWQKSREECQQWGGDLAVINNELVQKFLTSSGYMLYWIGLSFSETQKWMWIDNTTVTQSYWASDNQLNNNQGQCVLLKGRVEHKRNWYLNPCLVTSHYICQRQLK